MTKVALIVGGSIGAELVPPVLEVVAAAGAEVAWQRIDVPAKSDQSSERRLDEAVVAIEECGVALKTKLIGRAAGAGPRAVERGPTNLNVLLRLRLDLYAGVRPIRTLPGLPTRYPDLDLVLVRENTEDIYKGIEHEIVPGVVQSLKVVTRQACRRIATYAFALAAGRARRQLTFVHKGNIVKMADGLFLRTVQEVAAAHSEIGYREMIVDAACMQLVLDPYQFDVLLMGNLYGDILSNLGAGLAGGISTAHGVNVGDRCRVYEAIHGDAAHLVGTGQANPLPLLVPAIALLHGLGQDGAASRLHAAVGSVLTAGEIKTPDLGGRASTAEMCRAIIAALG